MAVHIPAVMYRCTAGPVDVTAVVTGQPERAVKHRLHFSVQPQVTLPYFI